MTATSPTGMPTAPDAPAGGPSLPQRRRLVTEVPGPKSRALMARKRAAVADGLGTVLPVFAQAAGGGNSGVTSVPVQIYNNSTVVGLAGRTGEQLRESGFAVGDVANLPSNRGVVAESTAFYGNGPGEQEAAQAVAQQLGIVAKPRPADMAADGPGVIVIVTQDLDR